MSITPEQLANMFNMDVNELCDLIGYSRNELETIISGKMVKSKRKKNETRWKLLALTAEIGAEKRRHITNHQVATEELVKKIFPANFDENC